MECSEAQRVQVQVRDYNPALHNLDEIDLYCGRSRYPYSGQNLNTGNRTQLLVEFGRSRSETLVALAAHAITQREQETDFALPEQQKDLVKQAAKLFDHPEWVPTLTYHDRRNADGSPRLVRAEMRYMMSIILMQVFAHLDFSTWQIGTPMYSQDDGFIHTHVKDLASKGVALTRSGNISSSFKAAWRHLVKAGALTQIRNHVLDENGQFWSRPATKIMDRRIAIQLGMSEEKLSQLEEHAIQGLTIKRETWLVANSRKVDAQKARRQSWWGILLRDREQAKQELRKIRDSLQAVTRGLKKRLPGHTPKWYRDRVRQEHPWRNPRYSPT